MGRDPQHQTEFLAALLVTALWIVFVAFVLVRPLHAALRDPGAASPRAAFCRTYVCLAIVLVPLAALLLAVPELWARDSQVLAVVTLVRWPFAALSAVVLLLGPLVGFLQGGPSVVLSVSPEQAGDLGRLLAKVDSIRAREVLRQGREAIVPAIHDDPIVATRSMPH
jgi:hypothetical protein